MMKRDNLRKWNATAAYALLQAATWSFYAVILSFSSNVLRDFGFRDSQISLLLGVSTVASFALQLLVAELVSRCKRLKIFGVILALGALMLAGNLVVLSYHRWKAGAILAFAMACMILQTMPSFANAMGMDAIERGSPTNYSLARGFGSLAYSLLAYVTGLLVRRNGTRMVPVVGAACAAALMIGAVWFHASGEAGLAEARESQEQTRNGGFLKQYPRFALFLLGSIFLQFSHNLLSNFMFQIMLVKNGGAGEQGTATAVCALVELPVMFAFPLMLRKVRCEKWVVFSSLSIAVKAIGIFLAATPRGIYAAQVTQIIGYGLYTISSVNYAAMVVGKGESVRAQSYLGSTSTVGCVLALSTGGVICEHFGAQSMVLVSLGSALIGGVTVLLSAQKTKT